MAEKEPGKPRGARTAPTTPEEFPVNSSQAYPSGDYSYILEIVMGMQNSVGKMAEAIQTLKDRSKDHGNELHQIGKDVHAAKVVVGVVGVLIIAGAAFLGWIITTYISAYPAK